MGTNSSLCLVCVVLIAMARYYSDQYLSDFWSASPEETVSVAMVETSGAPVVSRGLAIDSSVLIPLAVGAALLLLLKK